MALPSLTAVLAFDAAARHLSFTRAAKALHVQPAAVSRQIALLEQDLGAQLFRRTKPNLTLTDQGKGFHRVISRSLSEMERAAAAVRDTSRAVPLIVDVSIGIASCWLMPRLSQFRRRHPDCEVQLLTRDENAEFNKERADLIIHYSDGSPLPGFRPYPLFREELIAVVSPSLVGETLSLTPADLINVPRLTLSNREFARDWDNWFQSAGLPPQACNGPSFNSFIVYLQAALNGQGFALTWRHLTDDLIRQGLLVQVTSHSAKTSNGYYCHLSEQATKNHNAAEFLTWIKGVSQENG